MNKLHFFGLIFFGLMIQSFAQKKETYTYATKDNEELKFDIYYPDNFDQEKSFPALVWMHGGGFSGGIRDAHDETELVKTAAKKGYLGVTISYRLTRKGTKEGVGCDCPLEIKKETFYKASEDYLDAVSFLLKNQVKFKLDQNKIIAGGSSAGAEGILNAIYMKNEWFGKKFQNINFAGLFSLAGAAVKEAVLDNQNTIPAVFFHGAKDNVVPYETAPHHFCDKIKPGFMILKGSKTLANFYKENQKSYFLFTSNNGQHEISNIPFAYLDEVFKFFDLTVLNNKFQTVEITVD